MDVPLRQKKKLKLDSLTEIYPYVQVLQLLFLNILSNAKQMLITLSITKHCIIEVLLSDNNNYPI